MPPLALARVLNWRSSEECRKLNDCAIRLSSEDDKWLNFDNHCKKERVSFALCTPEVCIGKDGILNQLHTRIIITCLISDITCTDRTIRLTVGLSFSP